MPYYKTKDTDRAKKTYDENKLINMEQKLKNIEDLIIDETVKYTGAHEGISEPEEIEKLKDHVVSRLATAYSLEKMRRALDKLKQSVDDEKHIQHNDIVDNKRSENNDKEKKKRVATKKESVDHEYEEKFKKIFELKIKYFFTFSQKIDTIPLKVSAEEPKNSLDETAEMKKKRNGDNALEDVLDNSRFLPMSEGYMGGRTALGMINVLKGQTKSHQK
jgi:sulfite reductase alpha subunit-like flavoprotein